ncbi:IS1595 family transposase [Thiomicrospira sp.]|uniref:IS1595 family transposase n=1 Tax=Thiomicrospira sp. TaxID=935 RepID=UPI002F95D205
MISTEFNTILELLNAFPDEQTCIDHLTELRWPDGAVVSPFDSESKVYGCANNRYRCKNTGKYFNVKTATLFDNTKVKLQKWFLAIWLVTSHKKEISSIQLSKDIGVTQKTAWFMLHRIRNCFGFDNDLNNEVEVDETYVGSKSKNKHAPKRGEGEQGRSTKEKAPELGMVERRGKLNAKCVGDVTIRTLTTEIVNSVNDATIYSDELPGYNALKRIYDYQFIKHGQGQYVNGRVHTNTIEGFWSLLKRGIVDIYHFTNVKHLQKYVDEFVFRYNSREQDESQKFNLLLSNTEYRMTYKDLINV